MTTSASAAPHLQQCEHQHRMGTHQGFAQYAAIHHEGMAPLVTMNLQAGGWRQGGIRAVGGEKNQHCIGCDFGGVHGTRAAACVAVRWQYCGSPVAVLWQYSLRCHPPAGDDEDEEEEGAHRVGHRLSLAHRGDGLEQGGGPARGVAGMKGRA